MANSGNIGNPRRFALALAVSLTTATVYAEPVDVIYSAENALYGAGYDIGVADGWMDDQLRSAIRQYQSSRNDLQPTGNLDINTLFSLGIATENGAPVTGNQLPDRQSALSALGMSPSNLPSAGPSSAATISSSAPAPQPAPSPQPEAEPVPAPEPEPEPVAATVSEAEQTQPETSPATTESIASPSAEVTTAGEPEPESAVVNDSPTEEPEPREAPETTTSVASAPEASEQSEPGPEPAVTETDDQPEDSAPQQVANNESSPSRDESGEDTSSGGFFSWLYDFFFGWMF